MASDSSRTPVVSGIPDRDRLRESWRMFTRAATFVAVLTSPAVFLWFRHQYGWSLPYCLLATFLEVIAFRGLVDIGVRRFIPWPTLFGADAEAQQEDMIGRRRAWFWLRMVRRALWAGLAFGLGWLLVQLLHRLGVTIDSGTVVQLAIQTPLFFLVNFLIFFGPFLLMASSQISSYEPGDTDWGVRLDDVRGQAEAKEEVRRIVTLWQSGEAFERAGGKRERGLLMLGAPGTGKTMLSKAIATGFNCPFVSIPGSGFAGMFMGMDAITVRILSHRAKRLAAKWGGQCIVFIDEIDAVGQRRSSLGTSYEPVGMPSMHDLCFYGSDGALTSSGDLVLETREWRDRLFAARASAAGRPSLLGRVDAIARQVFPGGGMFGGGQLALNQLLVVMDGIGSPPWLRKNRTRIVNTFLDATYIIPARIGRFPLRLPRPRPAAEQIYFIGACNAPIQSLDPALTRPGRLGRHVWFRTPTKDDRKDIFDLYLSKVAHEPDLDAPERRDELARMTNGYSPAMIEQVCSMALTTAHYEGRNEFGRADIVEAMTTVESGTAINVEYVPEETRAVAIHEAGHAVAAHVYMKGSESTRLTIRKRGAALGHHVALEKEERFTSWRHEEVAHLVWTLGAMAAEHVFYGENSTGVGGDVRSATARAAWMVGAAAMGPEPIDFNGGFDSEQEREQAHHRLMERYERIGSRIMNRAGSSGPFEADPIGGVLRDRDKRAAAAQILGQAYVAAYLLIQHNKAAVERVADELVAKRELYGDEVVALLDQANLELPDVDLTDEAQWPPV